MTEAAPDKSPTLSQQFLSATAWNAVLLPARFLVGMVSTVVYYQVLKREEVGLVFFLTSLATTIGLYADLGIERSLPRFLPEVERDYGRQGVVRLLGQVVLVKIAILLVLIGLLAGFSAPLTRTLAERQLRAADRIEARIGRGALTEASAATLRQRADSARGVAEIVTSSGPSLLGAVAALLLLGALFDVGMQFLAAYFKQKAWNLITLVNTLLQPILVTALVLAGAGIRGVLIGLVLTPLVSLSLAAVQVRRAARGLATTGEDRPIAPEVWRRLVGFAGMNYLTQVTTWLYDIEAVVFFSAALLGFSEVAILGFAYKFAKDALGYIWTPLTGVMTPLLARIKARDSMTALRDAQASLSRLILLLVVPAGAGLAVLTPHLIAALYPKYVAAVPLILVFIAFSFAESVLSVAHNTLMVYGIYRPVIMSRLVPLLSIPLLMILVPRYGSLGVALAVGLVRVASRLVTVVAGSRRLGLDFPIPFALRVGLASAGFSAVIVAAFRVFGTPVVSGGAITKLAALVPLVGVALLGAALYVAFLRALGGLHADERRRILALPLPLKDVLRRVL